MLRQLNDLEIREWRVGRRFYNNGTTGHECWRDLPNCQQNGEIPRHNSPNHTHRRHSSDNPTFIGLFNFFLWQTLSGDRAQPCNRAKYFPFRSCSWFALLTCQKTHKTFGICFNNIGIGFQCRLALISGGFAPGVKSLACCAHRFIKLCFRCIRHLRKYRSGCRIINRQCVLGGHHLAINCHSKICIYIHFKIPLLFSSSGQIFVLFHIDQNFVVVNCCIRHRVF